MTPIGTESRSPVVWGEDGLPRSRQFGDVYFSSVDGLAEARAVFLAGSGLPDAWAGRPHFSVGELGFGSGLNIVALLDLWRRTRAPGARLHIFSVEAFPMPVEDARRTLSTWPEVADLADSLIAAWPRPCRGFHRVDLPGCAAVLDLAVMDVCDALTAWDGRADAWFLDGFSPACNPDMWSPRVFQALAARSAPGARAATFTVAGAVRRGLADAGFAVSKAEGFGRKRERLEAVWPGPAPQSRPSPRVAIIGAGVAGAALARAFRGQGVEPVVFEAVEPGAGASGNPAALVMPRLDAGGGPIAQLFAQAAARAADLYAAIPSAVLARGALQLENGLKDASRFDRIAASDLFAPGAVSRLDQAGAGRALGEPCATAALALSEAMVVRPSAVLEAWLARARRAKVAQLVQDGDPWRLVDEQGQTLAWADIVCLAAGPACGSLISGLPLAPVRGQLAIACSHERPSAAIGAGYIIPTDDGFLFGATHDRDDAGAEPRHADVARNLSLLAQVRPALARRVPAESLTARAGVRAVTPDFLPLAGAVEGARGVYVLSGLGSRGFCAAPLLAEHTAAQALGLSSPLPLALGAIVDPRRFVRRALKKTREPAPKT